MHKSQNDFHLTVYCDDHEQFREFRGPECNVVELAEITRLGAKRGKLAAFAAALREGSVLYLDADTIVLEDLSDLCASETLAGCLDDLLACPFITDRRHPWPGDPGLVNDIYINSGVLYLPAASSGFFEHLHELSLSDECWQRHIFPGKLQDNHFLCAYLNIERVPVRLLDPAVYGWPGFLKDGEVQVYRSGQRLVNKHTQSTLRLVIFAGLQQTPQVLRSLPIEIGGLICERISRQQLSIDEAFQGLYASLSGSFEQPPRDPFVQDILQVLTAEICHLAKASQSCLELAGRSSYFDNPEGVKSVAFAHPPSPCTWNGLRCGGPYLDAFEYRHVRRIVTTYNIRSVLSMGAGENSVLFQNLGVTALSLDVPFDQAMHRFSESEIDLLLIDSSKGTQSREFILSQVLTYVKPRFVLYRDSLRDSGNLFKDQMRHGLRLVHFFDSPGGLTLFAVPPCDALPIASEALDQSTLVPRHASLVILESGELERNAGDQFQVRYRPD